MKYYINNNKVTKKMAKEYVEKLWGVGSFKKREQEAKEYFIQECDNWCSWADGFSIQGGTK